MTNELLFLKTIIQCDKLGLSPCVEAFRKVFLVGKQRANDLLKPLNNEIYRSLTSIKSVKKLKVWQAHVNLLFGADNNEKLVLEATEKALKDFSDLCVEGADVVSLERVIENSNTNRISKYLTGLMYYYGLRLKCDVERGLSLIEQAAYECVVEAKLWISAYKPDQAEAMLNELAAQPEFALNDDLDVFAKHYGVSKLNPTKSVNKIGF